MADETEFCYVTTTGWKSGKPHEIEIWYVGHGDCYFIVSERYDKAHWVQNIQRDSAVSVRIIEKTFAGTARAIDPTTEPELVEAVSAKMRAKYGWDEGLIVELKPVS